MKVIQVHAHQAALHQFNTTYGYIDVGHQHSNDVTNINKSSQTLSHQHYCICIRFSEPFDECSFIYSISYSNDSSSEDSSSTWDDNFQAQWQDYLVRHVLD